jgi:hypothetical protein
MGLAAGTISLILSAASTAYSVYESEQAKEDAEDAAKLAEKQARIAERQEEIRAKRQARIRKAQIAASAGASGIGGSIVDAPTIGTQTSLETGLSLLSQQTEAQVAQIGASLEATKAGITSQQIKGLGATAGAIVDLSQPDNQPSSTSFTEQVTEEK